MLNASTQRALHTTAGTFEPGSHGLPGACAAVCAAHSMPCAARPPARRHSGQTQEHESERHQPGEHTQRRQRSGNQIRRNRIERHLTAHPQNQRSAPQGRHNRRGEHFCAEHRHDAHEQANQRRASRISAEVAVTDRANPISTARCGAASRHISTVVCNAAKDWRPEPRSIA